MEDILLKKLFEMSRWQAALARGIDKDIRKDQLYQLTKPRVRAALYQAIRDGQYRISPPHTALIPKDTPGEFRTVYVNEPVDRILLSLINDLLFELFPDFIHPRCKSYLKGTGCGDVVQEISRTAVNTPGTCIGWKSDLSKYFDSVPLKYIDKVFDDIEARTGRSAVIKVLRDYYHCDLYFDTDGNLQEGYQSLKQGCAVAAFLADAILKHVDERLAALRGSYTRYSDDMLYLGEDHRTAMDILTDELAKMDMKLNPKKVEFLDKEHWFKFLGFSIKGSMISLSSSRIKAFQKEIQARTVRNRKCSYASALHKVNRFLYEGCDGHSWATQVLRVINVRKDVNTLNEFVMDCLRAKRTGKDNTGGLGYVRNRHDSCVDRGRGRNVSTNRKKTETRIDGFLSLGCMQNALLTSRAAYDTLTATLT